MSNFRRCSSERAAEERQSSSHDGSHARMTSTERAITSALESDLDVAGVDALLLQLLNLIELVVDARLLLDAPVRGGAAA